MDYTYQLWLQQCEGHDPENLKRELLLAQTRGNLEGLEAILARFNYVVYVDQRVSASGPYEFSETTLDISPPYKEKVIESEDTQYTVLRGNSVMEINCFLTSNDVTSTRGYIIEKCGFFEDLG